MSPAPHPAGVVLICDQDGNILQLIQDDLGLLLQPERGTPFPVLVDRASLPKALSFLVELRGQRTALQWEMNVPTSSGIATLCFGGRAADAHLAIVAARTSQDMLRLLQGLDGERATPLRLNGLQTQAGEQRDARYYEELSQLNNEMANLQRELAKKNAELEQLNQLKNQFLGMAAHDLRSPLGVIRGYSELLLSGSVGKLEAEQLEFLSTILSSAEFMLQLIDDLLDMSAIESGRLQLSLQPTDPIALVKRVVSLHQVLANRKKVTLEAVHDAPVPPLMLDSTRMEQALNNLLSNAIKFSYPQSVVTVRTRQRDGRAIISVIDHGCGMPPDQLDELFQWFGQRHARGTAGERSTGLGLAITHKIVTEHGGRIWAESELGRGSAFHIALPTDTADDREQPPAGARVTTDASPQEA
jgi:signal transduction histidine kinase